MTNVIGILVEVIEEILEEEETEIQEEGIEEIESQEKVRSIKGEWITVAFM